jgi:hypothetical protein
MNTATFAGPTSALATLWNRFQIWRAMRLLRSIPRLNQEGQRRFRKAQELLKAHTVDPQQSLPLGE